MSPVVRPARQPEVGGRDELAIRHDDGALDLVFEFAHVARPGIRLDSLDGIVRKTIDGTFLLLGVLLQERAREDQSPLLAVAIRRDIDRDFADAVEEIFAKQTQREFPCGHRRVR